MGSPEDKGWIGAQKCKVIWIALRKSNNDKLFFVLWDLFDRLYIWGITNRNGYNSSIACSLSLDMSPFC